MPSELEDSYRLWGLCIMLRVDVKVDGNVIKIVKNDPFIECLHDLHMISF